MVATMAWWDGLLAGEKDAKTVVVLADSKVVS